MNNSLLIKIGDSLLHGETVIDELAHHILKLQEQKIKIILVHGGGKLISQTLHNFGVESQILMG